MEALTRDPSKELLRVWDKDFNLVYTFDESEGPYPHGLPLDHPVAVAAMQSAFRMTPDMWMTTDRDGKRRTEHMSSYEIRESDGVKGLIIHLYEI